MRDIPAIKQALRKNILSVRERLLADVRSACDAAITERLLQLPEYKQATTVLGYMNFGSEYACELWVAQALIEGKRLVLPKVNRHTNHLDLYRVDDPENQLEAGLWGIREPIVERCEQLNDINEVEFALLPGVAFCREGARLGYGGGFYDKLLANVSPRTVRVAAAYTLQLVAQLPQEATDVKVGWIVTEEETINCLTSRNS